MYFESPVSQRRVTISPHPKGRLPTGMGSSSMRMTRQAYTGHDANQTLRPEIPPPSVYFFQSVRSFLTKPDRAVLFVLPKLEPEQAENPPQMPLSILCFSSFFLVDHRESVLLACSDCAYGRGSRSFSSPRQCRSSFHLLVRRRRAGREPTTNSRRGHSCFFSLDDRCWIQGHL